MKTLDERLEFAADEVEHAVARMPSRRAAAGTKHRWLRAAPALVAFGLIVVAVGAGAVLLRNDAEVLRSEVTDGGAEFPRLSLDAGAIDGDVALVFAEDSTVAPQPVPAQELRVFGEPTDLASGRLYVVTDTDGSDFFRGEAFDDPGWSPVPVMVGSAHVLEEGLTSTIMWEIGPADGLVVSIQGLGLDTETVLEVLDGVRFDGDDVAIESLPDAYTEIYAGPMRGEGERVVMLVWSTAAEATPSAEITLWLHEGIDPFERGLYTGAYETAESIVETKVLGRPALRVELSRGTAFHWLHSPTVYARLLVQGSMNPDDVVGALREIDAVTWEQQFEVEPAVDPASPGTTVAPTTVP